MNVWNYLKTGLKSIISGPQRTTIQEPNDSILYESRVTSQSIDWSFKDSDIMSSDDSSDWDQIKSMSERMTTSTPQTKSINALKPTNGRTNQRKRSYIPQHLERTVLEWSPYSSPYTPKTAVKKNRQSTDDRTYKTGINTTLFEDNSIHRSFRSTTTETNESLRDIQMETEFQSNPEIPNKEVVETDLSSDIESEAELPNNVKLDTVDTPEEESEQTSEESSQNPRGLQINGLEFISTDQLKQLNQKVFVFFDLESDLKSISKRRQKFPNKGVESETEEEVQSEDKSDDNQGLRRSKRTRMHPMEYWRGERPVYKRDKNEFTEKVVAINIGFESEELKRKKRTNKRKFENKCQKNINVFDLSIHNKEIEINENKDSINIKSLETLNWNPCPKSEGVDIAFITYNKQKRVAVGLIRIQGLRSKKNSWTGNYVSHFTVTLGVLALSIGDEDNVVVKTGDNFTIDSNTIYSLSNQRNDISYINFTLLKK